jgi:hypothetical protein
LTKTSTSQGFTVADEFNPYAAPTSTAMHPRAAEWLQSPDDPSLQKVASGLGMIYNGILVVFGGSILGALAVVFAFGVGGAIGGMVVVPLVLLALLTGVIMIIVGTLKCLATPEETGAKGLIGAAVTLYAAGFILSVIWQSTKTPSFLVANQVIWLGGSICFLLFLRQLAQFIGAGHLAERARLLLVLLGVTTGVRLLGLIGQFVSIPLLGLLGFGALIISLVSFFLYLGLLNRLRIAIQSGGASYV